MIRILFVCMGNICRSPSAEGVFRDLVREAGLEGEIDIDSAGTHGYHVGRPPDERSRAAALARGRDISDLRARQVALSDFAAFDYVLSMDDANHAHLMSLAPAAARERIWPFLDFAIDYSERSVPDPYYGGEQGFEHVLDLIEDASRGLLAHLRRAHGL